MSGPQPFLPPGRSNQSLDVSAKPFIPGGVSPPPDLTSVATDDDPWGPARTSSSGAMSNPSTQAATVGGGSGAPLPKRSRFFMSGTILTASWGPGSADELEDEYPGVEFDVHKPKVGKKASITIMGPSKVVLRGVVETLLEQVGGALVLDEEIYRELPSGDSEVVGTLATAPSTSGMGSKSNSNVVSAGTSPQTVSKAPGSNVLSPTQPMPPQNFNPMIVTAGVQAPLGHQPGEVSPPIFLSQQGGSRGVSPPGIGSPVGVFGGGTSPMPEGVGGMVVTQRGPPEQQQLIDPTGSKFVVDPMSTKLAIPFESIYPTAGIHRQGIPSLCMLFLNNRCRQGDRCFQIHADGNVVLALRGQAYSNLRCCIVHGSQTKMPERWQEKYLILFQGGSGNPHPITRLVLTAGLQRYVDQYEQLNGPPPEGSPDQKICLCIDSGHICRKSGSERCHFGEECKFLHLCKELLWYEIAPKNKAQ